MKAKQPFRANFLPATKQEFLLRQQIQTTARVVNRSFTYIPLVQKTFFDRNVSCWPDRIFCGGNSRTTTVSCSENFFHLASLFSRTSTNQIFQ